MSGAYKIIYIWAWANFLPSLSGTMIHLPINVFINSNDCLLVARELGETDVRKLFVNQARIEQLQNLPEIKLIPSKLDGYRCGTYFALVRGRRESVIAPVVKEYLSLRAFGFSKEYAVVAIQEGMARVIKVGKRSYSLFAFPFLCEEYVYKPVHVPSFVRVSGEGNVFYLRDNEFVVRVEVRTSKEAFALLRYSTYPSVLFDEKSRNIVGRLVRMVGRGSGETYLEFYKRLHATAEESGLLRLPKPEDLYPGGWRSDQVLNLAELRGESLNGNVVLDLNALN